MISCQTIDYIYLHSHSGKKVGLFVSQHLIYSSIATVEMVELRNVALVSFVETQLHKSDLYTHIVNRLLHNDNFLSLWHLA